MHVPMYVYKNHYTHFSINLAQECLPKLYLSVLSIRVRLNQSKNCNRNRGENFFEVWANIPLLNIVW